MGLFSRKPRLKNSGAADFGILQGDDSEPQEGGPGPFKAELDQLRFVHAQESVNLARSEHDPDAWADGRLLFDLETALAHHHEQLRLQVWSRNEIQENAEEIYSSAGEVALAQAELEGADAEYLRAIDLWRDGLEELRDEPQEVVRLNNLRSQMTRSAKLLVASIFIVSEFIITGFVFNQALPLDIPFIGYILALGVMVLLVAVPHYLAQGLKEGITKHHRFDLEDEVSITTSGSSRKQRQAHREDRDDLGFRIASGFVGVILLILVVPLSFLRASETLTGNKIAWLFTFLSIQLAVSGYFFLREWLDYGAPSANLHRLELYRKRAQREREDAFGEYSDSLDTYFQDAAPVFKTMIDTARMDALIVEAFYATLHFGRHMQVIERPDLAVFINGARIPYLGARDEIEDERGLIYDAISSSNRSLEQGDTRGRDWWLAQLDKVTREMTDSLVAPGDDNEVIRRPASGVLVDSAAREWLYGYLDENFGVHRYVAPVFDVEAFESREDEGSEVRDPIVAVVALPSTSDDSHQSVVNNVEVDDQK
jgi:hypothetical protein